MLAPTEVHERAHTPPAKSGGKEAASRMIEKVLAEWKTNRLAKNAGWMFAGQTASLAIQACYFVVLARLLGSREYGILVGASSLVAMLSPFSSWGSGLLLLRYVSPNSQALAAYWGNVLLSISAIGGILVLLLTFFGHSLNPSASTQTILMIAIADCLFGQLSGCAAQAFQACEGMGASAALNTITNASRLLLAIALLVGFKRVTAECWAGASLVVSCLAATLAVVKVTNGLGWPKFSRQLFFRHAVEGLVFAMSSSTTSAYNDVDKVMLGHYGLSVANGIYTTAYRIVDIGTTPIRSIHAAALPRFFQLGGSGLSTLHFAKRILSRTVLFGAAASLAMFAAAPILPVILGKSFAQCTEALRWLCLIPVFRSLHLSAGDAIAGAGFQNLRFSSQLIAAVGNFSLNLYLIPRHSWLGAAWASLLTDGTLAMMNWGTLLWLVNKTQKTQLEVPA